MIIRTMGETQNNAKKEAGQFFANEGKDMFTDLRAALTARLSDEVRGRPANVPEPHPGQVYIQQASQTPMIIGAAVLGGVAILALVLK